MNIKTGYEPKCIACVDYYHDECHCQKSIYCGTSLSHIPWEGCSCYLSQRKWGGHDKPKKKRKKKWMSMEEFEFGV